MSPDFLSFKQSQSLAIRDMKRIVWVILLIIFVGCGENENHAQLDSANERIKDLEKNVIERESRIISLQEELAAMKEARTESESELAEKQKAEVLALREFHAVQLADSASKISELQLELSLTKKELMAVQALLEQPDRLNAIKNSNIAVERIIWIVICISSLSLFVIALQQYKGLRKSRRIDLSTAIGKVGKQ